MMTQAAAATQWAWLLPGARLHVWHPQVRPLLFALGLHDFFHEHPAAEVWATGCPPEVADYITELADGAITILRDDRRSLGVAEWVRKVLDPLISAAQVLRRVRVRARASMPAPGADLVLYSIALSERSVIESGDHYFGRALDDGSLKVHWLYQFAGSAGRADIEDAVRQTGRSVTWVHECVGWREAASMLWTAASVRSHMRSFVTCVPPLVISGATSSAFARRYVKQLLLNGSVLGELMVLRAVIAMVRASRPAAVCYPYEEKGLERAIVLGARAATGCRTIGFAHAAYASGYMYLEATAVNHAPPPRPEVLAAAGRGLSGWMQREFGRHDSVTYVGSPRWAAAPSTAREDTPGRPLRVLVLVSFPYEMEVMADWIHALPDLFEGMMVTIRPNPKEWPREQAAASEGLRGAGGVVVDGEASLETQIAECDVAVFCATSAMAEAIWHGRIALHAEWSDLWSTDPTKGKEGESAVPKCGTPAVLRQELLNIGGMGRDEYARVLAAQQVVAASIYGPFDHERFRNLVLDPIRS